MHTTASSKQAKTIAARRPKHISAANARLYVLDCAISDRQAYLDAIRSGEDAESLAMQAETRAELAWFSALRARELRKRRSTPAPASSTPPRQPLSLVDLALGIGDTQQKSNNQESRT
jgi:hypothetical protein